MKQSRVVLLALVTAGAVACVDTPTQPEAAPSFSAVAASPTTFIVEFNGKGPAKFADRVAALGGSVVFEHASGISIVSGLDDASAQDLRKLGGVASVLPDVEMSIVRPVAYAEASLAAAGDIGAQSQANPATALRYSFQWNLRAIDAPSAWAAGKLGDPGVTVAILDTGLDYDNRDLRTLVDLNRSVSFVPMDTDTLNWYFGPGWHPVTDLNGHGTNVAAQVSSIAFATAGVTSKTTLMGVKVLNQNGSGNFNSILQGVLYATDAGADVINMSLGFPEGLTRVGGGSYISLINRVFSYAHQNGAVVVVSAGNDAADMDHDGPTLRAFCQAPNVVCVSATGPTAGAPGHAGPWVDVDAQAYYTNFGRSSVSVAGPGGNIGGFVWSFCARHAVDPYDNGMRFPCTGGGSLIGMAGTSQAAPHVAGVAALLVAELGKNNPAQVVHALTKSAEDLGQPGTDPVYGKGRINVARALGLD